MENVYNIPLSKNNEWVTKTFIGLELTHGASATPNHSLIPLCSFSSQLLCTSRCKEEGISEQVDGQPLPPCNSGPSAHKHCEPTVRRRRGAWWGRGRWAEPLGPQVLTLPCPPQGHRMLGKSGLESSKGRQAAQGQGGRKKRCTGLDSLWPLRSPPVWSPTPHRWGDRLPGKPKGPRDTTPAIAGSSQPALPKGCSSLQAPLHSIPNTSLI